MNFIDFLADKTARYRVNKLEQKAKKDEAYLLKEYNEKVSLNPFYKIEKILSESKHKIIKLARQDIYELQKYVWFSIYNEIFVLGLMLIISYILGILLPMSIILTSFLIARLIFKGDHINSLSKCTIFTLVYLVGVSYILLLLIPMSFNFWLKMLCYIIIGVILEFLSTTNGFKKLLNVINNI